MPKALAQPTKTDRSQCKLKIDTKERNHSTLTTMWGSGLEARNQACAAQRPWATTLEPLT